MATSLMPLLKTFIVEDSPVIRENLIATLEELTPLRVVGSAESETSALNWLQQPENECELVIVDLFLKQGSGLGVLKVMDATMSRHLKRVVLSNYATPDTRRQCMALGADRVFDKSSEIESLILYCIEVADGASGAVGSPFS